jgi:hypothetical protein
VVFHPCNRQNRARVHSPKEWRFDGHGRFEPRDLDREQPPAGIRRNVGHLRFGRRRSQLDAARNAFRAFWKSNEVPSRKKFAHSSDRRDNAAAFYHDRFLQNVEICSRFRKNFGFQMGPKK